MEWKKQGQYWQQVGGSWHIFGSDSQEWWAVNPDTKKILGPCIDLTEAQVAAARGKYEPQY
jgi:hypothetical protein